MKPKNICRCCKSKNLYLYLKLGKQPLANSYHKKGKLKKYPLEVNLCTNCFHSQLSVVVNPDAMFKNYLYVSGTTETFKKHTKSLSEDAVKRFSSKKLKVLDIACNDGTQLEYFRELGCKVMGVDPAENLRPITKEKNINVLVEYWRPKIAEQIKNKFHIITGTNVFAHVDDLDEFLEGARIALINDGLLILEFPYAFEMITHNEFDTVYHEHLSYFLVNSFSFLATRTGFTIVDVLQTQIHGGSIRFFLKKSFGKHTDKVNKLIKLEESMGLLNKKTYSEFSSRVKQNKKDMKRLADLYKSKNQKIVGYGASAKGNTMLNYFKLKLDYIVDDNELKWEYRTPGMNIPIKSPLVLKDEKAKLNIVIMSWNFYNEIIKKIKKIRGAQDSAILYVPKVEIRRIKDNKKLTVSA